MTSKVYIMRVVTTIATFLNLAVVIALYSYLVQVLSDVNRPLYIKPFEHHWISISNITCSVLLFASYLYSLRSRKLFNTHIRNILMCIPACTLLVALGNEMVLGKDNKPNDGGKQSPVLKDKWIPPGCASFRPVNSNDSNYNAGCYHVNNACIFGIVTGSLVLVEILVKWVTPDIEETKDEEIVLENINDIP